MAGLKAGTTGRHTTPGRTPPRDSLPGDVRRATATVAYAA